MTETIQLVPKDSANSHNKFISILSFHFLEILQISENIRQLLWFGDGKLHEDYNPENDQNVLFQNELFRITFSFSFQKEPSPDFHRNAR